VCVYIYIYIYIYIYNHALGPSNVIQRSLDIRNVHASDGPSMHAYWCVYRDHVAAAFEAMLARVREPLAHAPHGHSNVIHESCLDVRNVHDSKRPSHPCLSVWI
jgi:hypothetical protein